MGRKEAGERKLVTALCRIEEIAHVAAVGITSLHLTTFNRTSART